MPIKFKCGCGQVLSVPDQMAGKAGKCPKCKKALKVPSPPATKQTATKQTATKQTATKQTAAAKSQAAARQQPAPVASGVNEAGLNSLFEDAGLVQKSGPTCPSCHTEIKPGTVVCTSCGLNFESGEQLQGFNAQANGPEFDNQYLQEAAENMVRDKRMEQRRDKAAMPWWVIMSFLIGAVTLCAAGVVIVDGKFGTPEPEGTFLGKIQRWPVFTTLGLTAGITGIAITSFAHLNICIFAFTKNVWQGVACFFLPLIYSIIYGIMNWTDNKAPIKAIMMALIFVGLGSFLIIKGGGFQLIFDAF